MLQIEDLQVKLGDKEILKHIDLEIEEGETHILFGPNGSGKTSVLNIINGLYKADSGKVIFDGKDITGLAPHKVASMGMGCHWGWCPYSRPPSVAPRGSEESLDFLCHLV